jgi:hypothetical protein
MHWLLVSRIRSDPIRFRGFQCDRSARAQHMGHDDTGFPGHLPCWLSSKQQVRHALCLERPEIINRAAYLIRDKHLAFNLNLRTLTGLGIWPDQVILCLFCRTRQRIWPLSRHQISHRGSLEITEINRRFRYLLRFPQSSRQLHMHTVLPQCSLTAERFELKSLTET